MTHQMPQAPPQAPQLACPGCNTSITWSVQNPNRPFCSEQCKNKDFVAWADGDNALPGRPDYEDMFSNELLDPNY